MQYAATEIFVMLAHMISAGLLVAMIAQAWLRTRHTRKAIARISGTQGHAR
jgi:hypothetical protein